MTILDDRPVAEVRIDPPRSAPLPAPERPFRVAVLYADADSSRQAAAFSVSLAHGLCPGRHVEQGFWHLPSLADAARRDAAAAAFATADAVIVASHSEPPETEAGSWLGDALAADCIIVRLLSRPDGNWSITIRPSPGLAIGRTGDGPVTVDLLRRGGRAFPLPCP